MTDIAITKDATGEFMVAQVEGVTELGEQFIDSYVPTSRRDFVVVDAGRLVIHEDDLPEFLEQCKAQGLVAEC